MEQKEIMRKVDHTLLTQTATWEEIQKICQQGMRYQTASVCIPPSYVWRAVDCLQAMIPACAYRRIPVCTVIGFPNGYETTKGKIAETEEAVAQGAEEIDMVINLGDVKNGAFEKVTQEIREIRQVCQGHILKVIVETCLLTEKEKIKMCEVVSESGADFIKTSTGFSTAGATFADVKLFRKYIAPEVRIKAAGGISSFADAEEFLRLGADRLGTSRLVKILEEKRQLQ